MSLVERDPTSMFSLQGKYFEDISRYELLSAEQEVSLAQTIETGREAWFEAVTEGRELTDTESTQFHDGLAAREQFITANLRLVIHISRPYWKFNRNNIDHMDIFQLGNLGLEHAVEKFDWRAGYKFSTYASGWILNKVTEGISRESHMPINDHTKIKLRLLDFYEDFYENDSEILEDSGWSKERLETLRAYRVRDESPLSLDLPIMRTDREAPINLYDLIPDDATDDVEAYADAADTLNKVLEVARQSLSDQDYQAYIAILESTSNNNQIHSNLTKELDRTKSELQNIRRHVYAILRHPTSGLAADRDPELVWQRDGNCWESPTEIFFPKRGETITLAQKFCDSCPVKDQCLNYSLENSVNVGIWGSKSERQRRILRKQLGLGKTVAVTVIFLVFIMPKGT